MFQSVRNSGHSCFKPGKALVEIWRFLFLDPRVSAFSSTLAINISYQSKGTQYTFGRITLPFWVSVNTPFMANVLLNTRNLRISTNSWLETRMSTVSYALETGFTQDQVR